MQKREKRWGTVAQYKQVCAEIYEERNAQCERCGAYIYEPKWHNFNHTKDRRKHFLDKNEIELVCFTCHKAYEGIKEKNGKWLN